jgi:hypothetical protein
MVLKIPSVLASGRRRTEARCKDLVKVTVRFIRRGTGGEKRERSISSSPHRTWEQRLPKSSFKRLPFSAEQ